MNPHTLPSPSTRLIKRSASRGSTIVLVIMITVAVAIIAGVLLRYTVFEMRLNRRNTVRIEALNAAEAALEYAAAELATRLSSNRNFTTATLNTSPITTHNVRLPLLFASSNTSPTSVVPESVVLHVSNVTSVFSRLIDNNDEANEFDPLRGQSVFGRNIRLLARATARSPVAGETTVYSTQTFEVRDSRIFNYAIFYNLRMEFHPGARMDVWGPVHSNEDFHLSTNSSLYFYDIVSSAGDLIAAPYADKNDIGLNIWVRSGNPVGDGPIPQNRISGHTFGPHTNQYLDSSLATRAEGENFADRSSQIFNGTFQDRSMGVERQNPPGVLTPSDARQLIAPPDFSSSANESIEDQKFSRKAGLYVVVDNATADNDSEPRTTVFANAEDAAAYKTSPNRELWIANNPTKVVTPPAGMITADRRMQDNREGKVISMVDIDMGIMRSALQATDTTPASQRFQVDDTNWNQHTGWTGAVYVEVENPNLGYTTTSDIPPIVGSDGNVIPSVGHGTGTSTSTAVRLVNARQLPTLASANVDKGLTVATNAPVYIAGHFNANGIVSNTGAAVQNGSERDPDPNWDNGTPHDPNDDLEVPALIAADAINILSARWVNASGKPIGDASEAKPGTGVGQRRAVTTEISAVFMGGVVETPSSGSSTYSGGVENYPRFHERWGNAENSALLYRGSIAALFTSQYATGHWGRPAVYTAPRRRWGHHQFLADGDHPPFTPTLRTYRRLAFRDLTRAEYEAEIANAQMGYTEM